MSTKTAQEKLVGHGRVICKICKKVLISCRCVHSPENTFEDICDECEAVEGVGWVSVKDRLPEPCVEVLVEVDGHRGSMWRNNYNVVAYLTPTGRWREERHSVEGSLPVTHWMPLPAPPNHN